jgi:hypothetical protein
MKTNQIIAEFMGVNVITLDDVRKNKNPYFSSADGYLEDNLKYHTSWDWLMPVVDKIEQVHEGVPQELINLSLFSTRDEVYKAVVEFINEYNKRK